MCKLISSCNIPYLYLRLMRTANLVHFTTSMLRDSAGRYGSVLASSALALPGQSIKYREQYDLAHESSQSAKRIIDEYFEEYEIPNTRRLLARRSRYLGVLPARSGGWVVEIQSPVSGDCFVVGVFGDEEEAAKAYDASARGVLGDAVAVNFTADGQLTSAARLLSSVVDEERATNKAHLLAVQGEATMQAGSSGARPRPLLLPIPRPLL